MTMLIKIQYSVPPPPFPVFGRSVNPIPARGADHAHPFTTCPSRFLDDAPPLHYYITQSWKSKKTMPTIVISVLKVDTTKVGFVRFPTF